MYAVTNADDSINYKLIRMSTSESMDPNSWSEWKVILSAQEDSVVEDFEAFQVRMFSFSMLNYDTRREWTLKI